MLIEGKWIGNADRTAVVNSSTLTPMWSLASTICEVGLPVSRYILVASYSCPWSHATLIARNILGLDNLIPVHSAGGPRIQGYRLADQGPIELSPVNPGATDGPVRYVHQLYTATDPNYTGRATVPVLWDSQHRKLVLGDSADILQWLDRVSTRTGSGQPGVRLHPEDQRGDMEHLLELLRRQLAEPIYRAGLAREQNVYDRAVDQVFSTLEMLNSMLESRRFLLGPLLSVCDIRLFCLLVRFDAAYLPLFRFTRRRLADYKALWAFARDVMAWSGVRETVDMQAILEGYFLNDGDTNPHRIIPEAPDIDWTPDPDRSRLGSTV